MSTKQIYVEGASREVILKGVNILANIVKSTLGPKGKNVIVNDYPTKDGWAVAKAIQLESSDEAIGANIIKKVAAKIAKEVGDNTTTGTLIAQQIIVEGFKLIAAGHSGIELKRGIDKAVVAIVDKIKSMAEQIEIDSPKLKSIAYVSSNNDEEIATFVSEAFVKTGKDGLVTLEHSSTGESYVKVVDGMSIQRGYYSPLYITNREKLTCEFKDCYILISESKITTLKEILPILEKMPQGKSIVMIAEDFEGEALFTINTNRMKGFPICIIKSPGFGDNKKQILEDLAAVTGATIASDEIGTRIGRLNLKDLGTAESMVIGKDESVIVGGGGTKNDIDERVRFIKKSIELCPAENVFEKKQLEERLAKLSGGVGVIYVGAASEAELKEKYDRFEDAQRATECSLSEGVVVGGGVTLIRWKDSLDLMKGDNEGEQAGIDLMKKVMYAPFRQMAKNAEIEVMVKEVCGKEQNYGYNFKTDKFEDLFAAGVIDPAKVIRVAVENAASVAGTLLTTDSVIINADDELPPMLRK